jgi:hypothetical protein
MITLSNFTEKTVRIFQFYLLITMSHMAAIHPACKVRKGQVVPVYTMKAYRENRGTAPLILNLALGGGECLALCFDHFIVPGRNSNTH